MNFKQLKLKKRAGIIGMNVTPWAIGVFLVISTLLAIAAVPYFSNMVKENKQSQITTEILELYNSAQKYSSTATNYGYGYSNISAFELKSYIALKMAQDGTTGDAGYLCSSSAYGCQVKYYIAADNGLDTFHIYMDASEAVTDFNDMKRMEVAIQKAFQRTSDRVKFNSTATALTATNTDPSDVAIDPLNPDVKLEIWNLN